MADVAIAVRAAGKGRSMTTRRKAVETNESQVSEELKARVANVLRKYAAAFFIDCGDGEAGMLERAADNLAEYVVEAIRPQVSEEMVEDIAFEKLVERVRYAIFRCNFHPDEREEVIQRCRMDWGEDAKYERMARAAIAAMGDANGA